MLRLQALRTTEAPGVTNPGAPLSLSKEMSNMNDSSAQPVGSMNLQVALGLAEKGYLVFPCRQGDKRPFTPHGLKDATVDPDVIRKWYSRNPDLNVAVACGPQPNGINLLAVDVDPKNGGDETWAMLTSECDLPAGPVHTTPSGGWHYFYDAPADLRNTAGRIGKGIDTRGEGGYVVVPRSRLIDFETGEIIGHYSWTRDTALLNVEPPVLPQWINDRLTAEPEAKPAPKVGPGPTGGDGVSPADWLRSQWSWAAELEADGWTHARSGGGDSEWVRPGKSVREGTSATLHNNGEGPLVVWSTSVPDGGKPTRQGVGKSYSPFEYVVTFRHGGDRSGAAKAVRRAMPEPTGVNSGTHPAVPTGLSEDPIVDPAWWDQRPILAQVHQAAKAQMINPEGLLIQTLCRASALIPPCYKLPGVGGGGIGTGTLDLMGCVIAETGGGKTRTANIARSLVVDPAAELPYDERKVLFDMPVGSGEGLIDAYYRSVMEEDEDGKKQSVRRVWHSGMFMNCDEGKAFISMQGRKGVTIIETMNSAWSGETLGQTNTGGEGGRFRLIPAGTVRFSAVLNMQASNAHMLFDDNLSVVGFPGRLLFAPATDPEATIDGPEWPGPIVLPRWPIYGNAQVLSYDEAIHREIKERILAQARGEADLKRSQNIVGQCKVAAIFAMLDERQHVSLSDWNLAADVLARSSAFLAQLEADRLRAVRDDSHRRSEVRGEMEAVVETARDRAFTGKAADRILLVLADGPMAPSALSAKLTSRQREFRDEALAHLCSMGKVFEDSDGRWALTP